MLTICEGSMVEYNQLKHGSISDFLIKFEIYVRNIEKLKEHGSK